MELLADLIRKLNEQFAQNADPSQLLLTIHQIERELSGLSTAPKTLGTAKVAVMMPAVMRTQESNVEVQETITAPKPVKEKKEENGSSKKQDSNGWLFDPLKEIPTLAHQPGSGREFNEVMGSDESSLNDKLKSDVVELGHVLTDAPIRDLRKGIGVNDRYVFISELFRGDETMYERSIKTINSFRIFAEAEYWIERELKLRLAWDDSKPSTQQFYQLVKRRFS